MEKIKLLMRKKDELLGKRQAIIDKAVTESRGYTAEERTESQTLQQSITDIDEQIRELQEIEASRNGLTSFEDRGSSTGGTSDPADTALQFRNLGEFVRDINGARSGEISPKLRAYRERMTEKLRTMNITDGSSLGYLVPDQFEAGTLRLFGQGGHIRQRARVIPAGEFPDQRFIKRVMKQGQMGVHNGIVFNFTSEGKNDVKNRSSLEFELFTLDPSGNKIVGIYETTEESLQNPTAVSGDMEESFRSGYSSLEEQMFFMGDGVGKPKGILKSDALLKIDRKTAARFQFDDVVKMSKFMYPGATGRVWELSLDLYDQVASMVDGQNRLIMLAGDATKGVPDILHGRPIHWNEYSPVTGELGDAVLADWGFYYIKDGSGPYFKTDEGKGSGFESGVIKVAMVVKVDGDTWIREPLKLENGMKVSPFIALQ